MIVLTGANCAPPLGIRPSTDPVEKTGGLLPALF